MITKTWQINIEAKRDLWAGITKEHLEESIRSLLAKQYFYNAKITIEEIEFNPNEQHITENDPSGIFGAPGMMGG